MKVANWSRTIFEIGLIALVLAFAFRQPSNVRSRIHSYWRFNVVYHVPVKEKVVAITYDDGPHPVYTPEILDILDHYHVKATFFMVGERMQQYPDIVKRASNGGSVIANHTYTHPHDIEADTKSQVAGELEKCEKVIEKLTGKRAHLFRPPRGLVDGMVFHIAEKEGYRTILWSVCADHHDAPTPELMAARVLKHCEPGTIILAHDGSFNTRWKDVKATPIIIRELQKQGYRFVTVPELLELANKEQKPL